MNQFITEDASLMPRRATQGSAGYDFFAPYDFVVPAHGKSECIDSGVSVMLELDKVLLMDVRSSYGFKHLIHLANTIGIVDSDFYPNTIKCILVNDSDEDFTVHKGDRYMQGVIVKYYKVDDEEINCVVRTGGIGSTGQ